MECFTDSKCSKCSFFYKTELITNEEISCTFDVFFFFFCIILPLIIIGLFIACICVALEERSQKRKKQKILSSSLKKKKLKIQIESKRVDLALELPQKFLPSNSLKAYKPQIPFKKARYFEKNIISKKKKNSKKLFLRATRPTQNLHEKNLELAKKNSVARIFIDEIYEVKEGKRVDSKVVIVSEEEEFESMKIGDIQESHLNDVEVAEPHISLQEVYTVESCEEHSKDGLPDIIHVGLGDNDAFNKN